jgi:Zn-dependent peptidase ImmA (M78 family)
MKTKAHQQTTEGIPVNGDVLRWARETAGLSIDDAIKKIDRKGVTYETILAWEAEIESPTYTQLERLAYEIYKRPLAIFFFPEPPEEVTPKQSFRTLPDYEIEIMPSAMRMLLRKASVFQLNLYELYESVNPATKPIVQNLSFAPNVSAIEMAKTVREYLSVTVEEQSSWKNTDKALKVWREKLETHGVFVFKDAFHTDQFSGFCLYDENFPVIYVNNSKPRTRQIFTLFHELAHLLFKTGGIDTRIDDYIDYLEGDNKQIEILCNKFAGEFLVPTGVLDLKLINTRIDDSLITELAGFFQVSREVILRRIFDKGLINQKYYDDKVSALVREWESTSKSGKGGGGNYYSTQGAYLGGKYIEKAFSSYYQQRISSERLADYLGVKVKNLNGMESLLYSKGNAA